jgi:hypothetical protein
MINLKKIGDLPSKCPIARVSCERQSGLGLAADQKIAWHLVMGGYALKPWDATTLS